MTEVREVHDLTLWLRESSNRTPHHATNRCCDDFSLCGRFGLLLAIPRVVIPGAGSLSPPDSVDGAAAGDKVKECRDTSPIDVHGVRLAEELEEGVLSDVVCKLRVSNDRAADPPN